MLLVGCSTAYAAGELDTTFNTTGKVTTAIGSGLDEGYAVAIQLDGKIIVAGASSNGSNSDVAVVRYLSNGTLDTTFDTDGKVTTAIGGSHDESYAVAIQSDGKIVVAGVSSNGSNMDFAVVRYIANMPPMATDGTLTTNEDTAGSGTLTASDSDSNPLIYSVVTNGTKGTATVTNASTGAYTYSPNLNQTGTDTFTFKANDGTVDSNVATITVSITPSVTPPPPVSPPLSLPTVEVPPPIPSPRTLYLTVAGTGQGGVTSDPVGLDCSATSSACALTLDGSQWVYLTPTPATGATFSGWTGDPACTQDAPDKIFLLQDTACTATFDLTLHTLTVERNVPGVTITGEGLNCQDTPQGFLNLEGLGNLDRSENSTQGFLNLEGLGNLSNNLSSSENPGCQATYPYGTTVTLEASKAPLEWEFVGWGGSCDSQGQVTITRETVCRAKYREDPGIPNGIDGNGDGIPDTRQPQVVSLPDKVSSQYVTFEVQPETCLITEVYTDLPDHYGKPDKNKPLPQGLIYFDLDCPQAQISMYYHAVSVMRRNFIFQKYGPTVPGDESTLGWFTLPNVTFEAVTVGEKTVVKATYTVTDGGLGDSTGVDGRIVDPGGLGLP